MDLKPYKAALEAAERDREELLAVDPKRCIDCAARTRMIFWLQAVMRDLRNVIYGNAQVERIKLDR